MNLPPDIVSQISASPLKGVSCKFVPIDDKWGIKAYCDKGHCDKAYSQQQLLAKHDFSPPVGKCFQIGDYYCYSTRIAEVLIDPQDFVNDEDHWDWITSKYSKKINKATAQIRKTLQCGFIDEHVGNWGYYEGKLMLIDTDFY